MPIRDLAAAVLLPLLASCAMRPASDPAAHPRLYRVIVPVEDIEVAVRFHAALFGQPGERVSPGRHYLDLGGTILALYDPVADGDERGAGWRHHENQYLYIAVDDLEAARERAVAAGAELQGDIASMPWGERLLYLLDPSGNRLCLVDATTLFTGGAPDAAASPDDGPAGADEGRGT